MKIKKIYLWTLIIAGISILGITIKNKNKANVVNDCYKIGILQFIEHDCLDEARIGFIDGLKELGYENGKNIDLDYKNASGEQSNCILMANQLVNDNKNLILAIATPAAQAVANLTDSVPTLITSVTNPVESNLVKSNEKPGRNITGTSDLVPVSKQISLVKQIVPHAKRVAILYSSSEINSKYQADIAIKECEKLNLIPIIYTVSQSNEIQQIVESMKGKADIIYVPTDNLVVSNMPLVYETSVSFGIPIICSEVNSVKNGAVGTYGIDYEELGKLTAKQAVDILENKDIPQNMPIKCLNENKLLLNKNSIEKLNLKVPDELMKIAKII